MKYKVGDKVRVRRDLKIEADTPTSPGVIDKMVELAGKVLTIATECAFDYPSYTVEENEYHWTDDMFRPFNEGALPCFSEIVESMGIKKGDKVLIKEDTYTFDGEYFVDESLGMKFGYSLLGEEFKILPKPKTGEEILRHLKGVRGGWIPDWEDEDEEKYYITYRHYDYEWTVNVSWNYEIPGMLFFTKEAVEEVGDYLNTLTEEESMNLLEEMRV